MDLAEPLYARETDRVTYKFKTFHMEKKNVLFLKKLVNVLTSFYMHTWKSMKVVFSQNNSNNKGIT